MDEPEKKKRGGGSKGILCPEIHERIVTLIRAGNFVETAAAAAGVARQSVRNWLRRGADAKEPDQRYREFAHDVLEAMAEAEARGVQRISDAAETQWQAQAWLLERMYPHKWGRRTSMLVEHEERPPAITVNIEDAEARVRSGAYLTDGGADDSDGKENE